MAGAAGIAIAAGAVAAANEALFVPALTHQPVSKTFNWRIIPATAGLALALGGLEKLAPQFARGLAWLTLAGIFVFPVGNAPTPLENANKILGFGTKGKKVTAV